MDRGWPASGPGRVHPGAVFLEVGAHFRGRGAGRSGLLQEGWAGPSLHEELTLKVASQGWREVEQRCGSRGLGPAGSFCAPDIQSQGTLSLVLSTPRGSSFPRPQVGAGWGFRLLSGPVVVRAAGAPWWPHGEKRRPGFRPPGLGDPSAGHTFGASSPGSEEDTSP